MDRKRIHKQGTAVLTKGKRNVGHPRRTNFTLRVKEQALRPTASEFLIMVVMMMILMMMMMMLMMMMILRLGMRTGRTLGKTSAWLYGNRASFE
jgi:hypothetical protein